MQLRRTKKVLIICVRVSDVTKSNGITVISHCDYGAVISFWEGDRRLWTRFSTRFNACSKICVAAAAPRYFPVPFDSPDSPVRGAGTNLEVESGTSRAPSVFWLSCTLRRSGERFRDAQNIAVSFLFASVPSPTL